MVRTMVKLLRLASLLPAGLLYLAALSPAQAREPHYGALEHEGLLQCEDLYWHGERTEAAACYQSLMRNLAQPPQIRAEAMWAQGDVKTANSLFQTAVQSAPENPDIRVRWGELFMQTYQYQNALDLFQEALNLDPDHAFAHVGAAQALRQGGGEGVNEHIDAVMKSLSSPPGARLRALLMLSHTALEQAEFEEVRRTLDEAHALAQAEDLPRMEVHALDAAWAFLQREDPAPHIQAALEENPAYGDAWAIPGYFASINRLYEQAGDFYEQAVQVQPDHWTAHLELGQNYLRLNQVEEAVEHVQLAYEGDPFNPKAVNTLRLLDTFLNDFVTVSYPDPPEDGLPELTLRLHRDERDILKHYARELAEDSIATFSERYEFEPTEPIIIEIYPNHEDFVVRSIGMPGVGILGVTFGYLFAMDSPSGHPQQDYHWGTTLWHEMAHVFTLKATDNYVPRWFSEGISVFEEWRTGPIPGVRIPTSVVQAMAQDRFLPIAELDDGFMRPSYEGQVMVSYMQAGLVFEFIDLEYGFDRIVDILYRFNDGASPHEAIVASLGITIEDFDRHFKQFIDLEYGPLLSQLDTWIQDHQDSFSALRQGNWEEAVAAAERAIFLSPDYVEVDSPYIAMARAYSHLGKEELQFETLETYWRKGGFAPSALMTLGDLLIERERREEAVEVLHSINYSDPFNEQLHTKLGNLYLEQGKPRKALQEFQVNLALDPLDKAAAYYHLAQAYRALNEDARTMEHLMQALDIAPRYRPAQRLLLELSREENP